MNQVPIILVLLGLAGLIGTGLVVDARLRRQSSVPLPQRLSWSKWYSLQRGEKLTTTELLLVSLSSVTLLLGAGLMIFAVTNTVP